MSGLYIYGVVIVAIFVITGGLYAWAKYQEAKADRLKLQMQAAIDTARSAQVQMAQVAKTDDAVAVIKENLRTEQVVEQAKIDAGDRSFMSSENF
jgi:hypothetical protein